eukprot:CAMPEP_0179969240 /NCGR_PEP_ID=MMETSP0983-20121128/34426_1 /TAXON_ID=483367 /ORGANISM="non described non described, Strain CCMP 2436" /LENGTH=91 /DNA_ID=CAMNT_0021883359 /DNA_START=352 /DNA_END=627 /DNA_ORIENTATION=+
MAARTLGAFACETTSTMPMPQLKVRASSLASRRPVLASQAKTGGSSHDVRSSSAERASGRTRGRLSTSPPPVMCAMPLSSPALHRGRQLFT